MGRKKGVHDLEIEYPHRNIPTIISMLNTPRAYAGAHRKEEVHYDQTSQDESMTRLESVFVLPLIEETPHPNFSEQVSIII